MAEMIFGSTGVWYMIGALLVFFMQCGFAMVETGFTRAKNAGNIIMKNLMDFCIGTVVFSLLGFGLMMSETILQVSSAFLILQCLQIGQALIGTHLYSSLYSVLQPQQLFPVLWQSVQSSLHTVFTVQ